MLVVAIAIPTLIICVFLFGMNSSLADLGARAASEWSDLDSQLKIRHALIPALVEKMKGFVANGKDTFENLAKLRADAMHAATPDAKARAESRLSEALINLFAMAKNSGHLNASEDFSALQSRFASLEKIIQCTGRNYNESARELKARMSSFPMCLASSRFQDIRLFEDPEPPAVKT
jgi:LemA protein